LARTWPVTPAKRAALALIDAIGYALSGSLRLLRRRQPHDGPIKKILVIEPWQIGDVVLVTPLLAELRRNFPDASISLLAKPHAIEILSGSGLVDETIAVDLPWTRARGKYRASAGERRLLWGVVRRLKRAGFDVVLDARGDPRTHLLAFLIGAKRRVGYDLGGGWLLTDPLKTEPDKRHKIGDWLELLTPLGGVADPFRKPVLSADASRVANALRALERHGSVTRPVVAVHPGASHAGKRWPLERFADVSRQLSSRFGGYTVVFLEPDGYGAAAHWPDGALKEKIGLADLMAYIACSDLLICNDSGPMHLADALGIPLIAVFERGNPQWFGPSGKNARVVAGENAGKGISPAPVNVPPENPVATERVADAASQLLTELGFVPVRTGD
jgi:heptosyltransferase-3